MPRGSSLVQSKRLPVALLSIFTLSLGDPGRGELTRRSGMRIVSFYEGRYLFTAMLIPSFVQRQKD